MQANFDVKAYATAKAQEAAAQAAAKAAAQAAAKAAEQSRKAETHALNEIKSNSEENYSEKENAIKAAQKQYETAREGMLAAIPNMNKAAKVNPQQSTTTVSEDVAAKMMDIIRGNAKTSDSEKESAIAKMVEIIQADSKKAAAEKQDAIAKMVEIIQSNANQKTSGISSDTAAKMVELIQQQAAEMKEDKSTVKSETGIPDTSKLAEGAKQRAIEAAQAAAAQKAAAQSKKGASSAYDEVTQKQQLMNEAANKILDEYQNKDFNASATVSSIDGLSKSDTKSVINVVNDIISAAKNNGVKAAENEIKNMTTDELKNYTDNLKAEIKNATNGKDVAELAGKAQTAINKLLSNASSYNEKFNLLETADDIANSFKLPGSGTFPLEITVNHEGKETKLEITNYRNNYSCGSDNSLMTDFEKYKNCKAELRRTQDNEDKSLDADSAERYLTWFNRAVNQSIPETDNDFAKAKTTQLYDAMAKTIDDKTQPEEKSKIGDYYLKGWFKTGDNFYYVSMKDGKAEYISRQELDGKGTDKVNNFLAQMSTSELKSMVSDLKTTLTNKSSSSDDISIATGQAQNVLNALLEKSSSYQNRFDVLDMADDLINASPNGVEYNNLNINLKVGDTEVTVEKHGSVKQTGSGNDSVTNDFKQYANAKNEVRLLQGWDDNSADASSVQNQLAWFNEAVQDGVSQTKNIYAVNKMASLYADAGKAAYQKLKPQEKLDVDEHYYHGHFYFNNRNYYINFTPKNGNCTPTYYPSNNENNNFDRDYALATVASKAARGR